MAGVTTGRPTMTHVTKTTSYYDIHFFRKLEMVTTFNTTHGTYNAFITNLLFLAIRNLMMALIVRNFAENYNERLESLTLLCSIFERSKEQQQIVNDRFELSKKSRSLSKQALKRWFTDEYILRNPKIYEEISSMLNENNMEDFLKIYELFVKHKDNEKFENIKVKTLIMTGEFDSGSTPEMSKNLSKCIKNSTVKIIKNGKHLCGIECVDEVNHAIKVHVS